MTGGLSPAAEEELTIALRKVLQYGFGEVTIVVARGKVTAIRKEFSYLIKDPSEEAETAPKPAG